MSGTGTKDERRELFCVEHRCGYRWWGETLQPAGPCPSCGEGGPWTVLPAFYLPGIHDLTELFSRYDQAEDAYQRDELLASIYDKAREVATA